MILECPNCSACYDLPVDLPEDGRKVRCASCSHLWHAYPPEIDDATVEDDDPILAEVETPSIDPLAPSDALDDELELLADEEGEPEPVNIEGISPLDEAPLEIEGIDDIEGISPLDEAPLEIEGIDDIEEISPLDEAPLEIEGIDDDVELLEEPQSEMEDEEILGDIDAFDDFEGEEGHEGKTALDEDDIFVSVEEPEELGEADEDDDLEATLDDPPAADLESDPQDGLIDMVAFAEETVEEDPPAIIEESLAPEEQETSQPNPLSPQYSRTVLTKLSSRLKRQNIYVAGRGALAACLIIAISFTYFGRETVVRAVPGMASFYKGLGLDVNIRGLEFRGLTYSWEVDSGSPILQVRGTIFNITDRKQAIPTLVFALRDQQGAELFHWVKKVRLSSLSAGKGTAFTVRIPTPPDTVHSLQVRFAKIK